jgi:hypothetical protein
VFNGTLQIPDYVVDPSDLAHRYIYKIVGIADNCFKNNTGMNGDIIIPDTVTRIGKSAFEGCTNLKTITLSNNITEIPDNCFKNSINNKNGGNIIIPDTVTRIGKSAFEGCQKLGNITLSNTLQTIDNQAFYNCKMAKFSNLFPESVKSVGEKALYCVGTSASS